MKHELRIELSTAEGAMLRTVGLVERRGFRIRTCTLHDAQDDRRLLEMTVESARPAEVLKRQIERLHDVRSVGLLAASPAMNSMGLRSSMGSQR
jgi:acetolactate synthase regulatory subunit